MKLSAGEALKTLIRKLGIKNPEQYDSLLDELKTEFEEEIEGDLKQRIDGLKTVEEFKKDKAVRGEIKAEFLNGLEKDGLGEFVKSLDDHDQADYARKDGATNKIKFLIEATTKARSKQLPNNKAEEDLLRSKITEFETKVANGEYVSKSEIDTLKNKISALNEGGFKDKVLAKLSPKVVEHMNDSDLLELKVKNYMKAKNLIYDHDENVFYKQNGEERTKATKHDKTVELMGMDDLVNGVLSSDEKLVKKSESTTSSTVTVEVPKPVAGFNQTMIDKAEAHRNKAI